MRMAEGPHLLLSHGKIQMEPIQNRLRFEIGSLQGYIKKDHCKRVRVVKEISKLLAAVVPLTKREMSLQVAKPKIIGKNSQNTLERVSILVVTKL